VDKDKMIKEHRTKKKPKDVSKQDPLFRQNSCLQQRFAAEVVQKLRLNHFQVVCAPAATSPICR
jgi:hypothetical protein